MTKTDPLAEYREKREFDVSPEPSGRESDQGGPAPRFVVQKHDASTLHYDVRLEVGGVLKSWAVRKGPSTDPREKRLAVPVEDHPLAYASFEGVIPSGYGAGAVIVWDRGTYRNLREDCSMEEAIAEGKVSVWLDGEKLRGGYTLIRMKGRGGWLLVKQTDGEAAPERDITENAPASVVSGRTVEDVGGALAPRQEKTEASKKRAAASGTKAVARRRENAADGGPPRRVRVGRHTVEVTNPDRVLFPDIGLTKGDLADYYHRIADRMLPYLRGRPLTLIRHPEGIGGEGFVQQHAPAYYPEWVVRADVEKEAGGSVTHVVADNAATLIYLANQSVVTPHAWLSRVDRPRHPDRMTLDLDPPGHGDGSGAGFEAVRFAARAVRDLLVEVGLPAFLMATGSSGLHVVIPLDRTADFDTVRALARDLSAELARRHPDALTAEQRKAERGGRVFLDTLRNTYAHTAVPPYAVRPLPGAPVATPLAWEELADPTLHAGRTTVGTVFERLAQIEDPWAGMARRACGIARARRRLDALQASRPH
ncbi:MAG TPA: non-homologous end-joining DNA ligase [Rubricoccaceae bacterium]|jgi:bifunctional non-homologous end joining protein LigD